MQTCASSMTSSRGSRSQNLCGFHNSSMASTVPRKLCVKFESLKDPVRTKCVMLPVSGSTSSYLTVLKEILLKELLVDMSILDLQFNKSKSTRVGDLIIFKYDEDFGQAIEVDPSVVFLDKDIVMVKLRKVAVQLGDYEVEPAQKIGKKTFS